MDSGEGSQPRPSDELWLGTIVARSVLVVPILAILGISAYGLTSPLGDMAVLQWNLVRVPILIFCLLCLFWRRVRWAMVGVILAIVILTFAYMKGQERRYQLARAYLESCYDQIVQRRAPFPNSLPTEMKDGAHALRWYYQRNGDDGFGIAYVIGSNGYVLHYPDKEWKFISYRPKGYEPSDIREANTSSTEP